MVMKLLKQIIRIFMTEGKVTVVYGSTGNRLILSLFAANVTVMCQLSSLYPSACQPPPPPPNISITTDPIFTEFGNGKFQNLLYIIMLTMGRDSSVGIATRYGLDCPDIESQWGQDFPHPSRPALGPSQPPVQWVPGLSRG